jgi:polysaccharide biosynthesis protein PslH
VDILYLSPCLPYPPNKGERIRAFHEVRHLSSKHRVHVACFTQGEEERQSIPEFRKHCTSLYTEPLPRLAKLVRGGVQFAVGHSLVVAFHESSSMRAHVRALRVDGAVVYTSAMAPLIPRKMRMVIDHVDVDSEKWFQYARSRWPGFVFATEGRRLRLMECQYGRVALANCLSTINEQSVFAEAHPGIPTFCVENGVDCVFFSPSSSPDLPELRSRDFLVFVGVMNYYPNSSGICSFSSDVFPMLRRKNPSLELFIVGRDPTQAVQKLHRSPGITVTGEVPDVRPYLTSARAVVTPLPIARGVQNKVLESLAIGKQVLASTAVCRTFGELLPLGVTRCESADDYLRELESNESRVPAAEIRGAARERFSWDAQMAVFCTKVEEALGNGHNSEPRN